MDEGRLPKISQGTIDVFWRDLERRFKEGPGPLVAYAQEMRKRVDRNDPNLGRFIDGTVSYVSPGSPNMAAGTALGLVVMYELFQRQIEASNSKEESNSTRQGIPRVSPEAISAFIAEHVRSGKGAPLTKFHQNLLATNPVLADFLKERISSDSGGQEVKAAYAQGALEVYELLRRQAEIDQLG